MEETQDNRSTAELLSALKALENRISQIERRDGEVDEEEDAVAAVEAGSLQSDDNLEFRIGRLWLARTGISTLTAGIVFLLTLPYTDAPAMLPSLLGLVLAAGIIGLSSVWRETLWEFSRYLLGGGLSVLYFAVLRLMFFSERPVVTSLPLELVLLAAASALSLVVAFRRASPFITALSLTFFGITAVVSDVSWVVFGSLLALSVLTVTLVQRRWFSIGAYAVLLVYAIHFLWFLGNPFLGHEVKLAAEPEANILFAMLYTLVFALGTLLRNTHRPEDATATFVSFVTASAGYGLVLLLTLFQFQGHMIAWHLTASGLYLALSIAFWMREKSVYATFFYAMLGYMALSVAIINGAPKPDVFIWLCLQTVLVISTALWFRSRFIVVANFVIYLMVFIAYGVAVSGLSGVGVVFGIVAMVSARILRWQRERLELKTDMMREAYLVTALFINPYALYVMLPGNLVALSWILLAVLYYVLSKALKSRKYRWMALATMLATVLYVLISSIGGLSTEYRVLTFVGVGIVLLVTSFVYFRMSARSDGSHPKSV
jgi:hypothetical protein